MTERDAKTYSEAFGEAMEVETLAREFYEFRGRTEARLKALDEKLVAFRHDLNNLGGMARSANRNGQVRIAVLGGGGAALFEIVSYFLTHLR